MGDEVCVHDNLVRRAGGRVGSEEEIARHLRYMNESRGSIVVVVAMMLSLRPSGFLSQALVALADDTFRLRKISSSAYHFRVCSRTCANFFVLFARPIFSSSAPKA